MATIYDLLPIDQTYYIHPGNIFVPVSFAVTVKVLIHTLQTLYENEVALEGLDDVWSRRMIKADIDSGSEVSLGDAIENLRQESIESRKVSINFPFTVYNIGEVEDVPELKSHPALNMSVYCPEISAQIQAIPVDLQLLFISFFNTAHDYQRAMTILRSKIASTVTRLSIPITVDGTQRTFTTDMNIEITRGEFPFQYEKQRRKGEIFDIVHAVKMRFNEFVLNRDGIYIVEDAAAYLESYTDNSDDYIVLDSTPALTIPEVTSTSISDGATGITTTTPLVITFSEPVKQDTFSYYFTPFVSVDVTWDSDAQVVTITPFTTWAASTLYNFEIDSSLMNGYNSYMEEDFTMTFTTT